MKKTLIAAFVAAVTMAITSSFADDPHTSNTFSKILVLDTYDQLYAYQGFEGLVFVRDAGNTKTGQHGDPTVSAGYAMYVYDPRATTASKWKMVNKEELISKSNALNPASYVSKDMYQQNLRTVQTQIVGYEHAFETNAVEMAKLRQSIEDIHAAFDIETITKLHEENNRFRTAFGMMTNITVSTTSTFGELKTAVVDILKAADYAIGGEGNYDLKNN